MTDKLTDEEQEAFGAMIHRGLVEQRHDTAAREVDSLKRQYALLRDELIAAIARAEKAEAERDAYKDNAKQMNDAASRYLRRAAAAEKLTGELSPQSRASYSFPILAADIRALKTKSDA
jgi:uncharacterized protein YdcH (DUF465 family)